MSDAVICLGVPHCPWLPERVASLSRLIDGLGYRPPYFRLFTDRESNWQWSQKLWGWAVGLTSADPKPDYLIQLQDDAIVGPNFWPDLRRMIASVPDQVIGLESVHPSVPTLHQAGIRWLTTRDGIIGVAYVFPISLLKEFLDWRSTEVRAEGWKKLNEDQLIGLWSAATGRRIWHPVTTIIDHDVELASTYGNDAHTHRRPVRTTARGDEIGDFSTDRVAEFGCFYGATPRLLRRWVKGVSMADLEKMR